MKRTKANALDGLGPGILPVVPDNQVLRGRYRGTAAWATDAVQRIRSVVPHSKKGQHSPFAQFRRATVHETPKQTFTRRRQTGMLSASDKVKAVDVVEDAARWHGTVDTKSVDAVGTEQ